MAAAGTARLHAVTATDGIRLAILVGCVIAYVELSRGTERARKLATASGPYLDGLTPWNFAAVLLLPPVLASGLVIINHTYMWLRVWRGRRPLYRWVFSTATVLLGTQAAALVLTAGPGPHPGLSLDPRSLPLVLAAAALRWFINYALVVGAILLSTPDLRATQVFSQFGDQLLEAGALGLGLVAASLLELDPYLLFGIVIGLVALHRGVLLGQFRAAARTDGKTGLDTAAWWHQIAEHAFARARSAHTRVAVLMLDLDRFKHINDTYGHLAGDQVLHGVGQAIRSEVRTGDAVGRWGGEEFAILVPDMDTAELRSMAERLRRRIRTLAVTVPTNDGPATVTDLSISVGGAHYPAPGIATLEDLLVAADAALYRAKEAAATKSSWRTKTDDLPSTRERNMSLARCGGHVG